MKTAVLHRIAEVWGVSVPAIYSKSRIRAITEARFVYMWYLRKEHNMSFQGIGFELNRNHSTVAHAVKMVDTLYWQVSDFREKMHKTAIKCPERSSIK